MEKTGKIACAIIGLGRIASLLEDDALREKPATHAGAISGNRACELTAGCDTNEERRRLFGEKWGVPVYACAEQMLAARKPEILSVATHPDSHYHYCRLAARMGVSVVICEKPLADNLAEAKKIARLAKYGGIKIITNHERRYCEDYGRVKKILESEKLGALLSVRAALYMGKNKRLIDVFWHDGTHLADAIMFLTGSVLKHKKSYGASLASRSGTAWLEGSLKKNKKTAVPVALEIGAGRDHLVFEMEFSCEKGRIRIGNGIFEVWESGPSPYAENFRSLKQTGETFSGQTGYFSNMVKDAVRLARSGEGEGVSSAACGLRVIEYLNSAGVWKAPGRAALKKK